MRAAPIATLVLFHALLASRAHAADKVADPTDYLAVVATLVAGDTLALAPGTYRDCLLLDGVHGTAADPIVISGPPAGAPAIFLAERCTGPTDLRAATIVLRDASHIVLRRLEIDGQGLRPDGIEADYDTRPVHHITIDEVYIHDQGDGQANAISTKCPAWDWVVRRSIFERVGSGFYLGDSNGSAPFIRGTLEHNLVLDPIEYGVQIKHQRARPALAGMPADGSVTTVRHNVLIKTRGSTLAVEPKPNLLVGDLPATGVGSGDRYEIYGNFLFQNDSDVEPLFQGEGNFGFYDNLLFNTFGGAGVFVRPHNGLPRDIAIFHNTVVTRGPGIIVRGGAPSVRQRVVGNLVFGSPPIEAADQEENFVGPTAAAALFLNDATLPLTGLDLHPTRTASVANAPIDPLVMARYGDADRDFNGRTRDGTYRGAYHGAGPNPGWRLAPEIKTLGGGPDASVDASVEMADAAPGLDAMTAAADAGASAAADARAFDAGVSVAGDAEPSAFADASPTPRDAAAADALPMVESEGCDCDTSPRGPGAALETALALAALWALRRGSRLVSSRRAVG